MHDSIPDKKKLGRFISKALETVSVGSIVVFEEAFGYLWGNGKPEEELNEEERDFRDAWMEVRRRIFERASLSKETVRNNISQYSVRKKRFFHKARPGDYYED